MLADPLVEARPGLAGVIVGADDDGLDQVERLCLIHRMTSEQDPAAREERAKALARRLWPNWR